MIERRDKILYRVALGSVIAGTIATIVWTAVAWDTSAWSVSPMGIGLGVFLFCAWLNFDERGRRIKIGRPRNKFLDRTGKDSR